MLNDKQLKIVMTLAVFAVSLGVYLVTLAPTVTFWDCGELIAASNVLGNPHPPGNPLFTVMARVFIILVPLQEAAARVNFASALMSSLTVMVAFLFIIKLLGILFEGKLSRFITYCSAVIGASLISFSDTFWFNSVESEVYGTAMLVVMLVSWLSLDWYERRGTPKANRNLILICYLAFLGMGVHPFSFISIPVLAIFLLWADKELRTNIPFLLTGVALMSMVYSIGNFLFIASAMLVLAVLMRMLSSSPEWKSKWAFSAVLCLVALLGFSSYAYSPIRSSVSPSIDENEPRTWQAFRDYIERKQYGSESMLTRAFHRRGELQNQVLVHPHMGYGGYMLAQYFPWKVGAVRADENEPVVRDGIIKHKFQTLTRNIGDSPRTQFLLFLLFQIPFLYGGYLAYKRNPKIGGYLLMLYAATSYGLIFYMNFADGTQMEMRDYQYWKSTNFNPQAKPNPVHLEVRDRDYFFTPGFIYMGILFGVAAAFLLEKLSRMSRTGGGALPKGAGLVLAFLAMAVPIYSNFKENNRHGDYIPWDYAYNLLNSCRPNSVLFTNGDNDTFPLWFIQEVEGIRKDVRVVNLSLVNTDWYIRQLRSHEPALSIGFTDDEIRALEPQPWRFKEAVGFKVPNSTISVELTPRSYLKVQDIMVLHIVQNNYPKRPIHFAVTVSDDNMMGLEKYLIMEGMVYTLTEERKNKEIDVQATARLVDSVYRYRSLGDPKVYVDQNTEGLLTNYSATNFRLVMWAQERIMEIDRQLEDLRKQPASDSVKAAIAARENDRVERIAFAEKYLQFNARILPREWRNNYYGAQLYAAARDYEKAEAYYRKGIEDAPNPRLFGANLAQLYIEQDKFAQAESLLHSLKDGAPNDFELWYGLSELYQKRGEVKKSRDVLAEWLRGNPSHQYASMVSQQLQFLEGQIRNQAAQAAPGADSAKPGVSSGGVPGLAPVAPKEGAKPDATEEGDKKDTAQKGTPAPAGKS